MTSFTSARFVIAVPDLQASAGFYRDVLGFTVRPFGDPGWLVFERDTCIILPPLRRRPTLAALTLASRARARCAPGGRRR